MYTALAQFIWNSEFLHYTALCLCYVFVLMVVAHPSSLCLSHVPMLRFRVERSFWPLRYIPSLPKILSSGALGFSCRQRVCSRIGILFLHAEFVQLVQNSGITLHNFDINATRTHQVQRNKSWFGRSESILSLHKSP